MFTVGQVKTVCELLGRPPKNHGDIPWVVQVAYNSKVLRDPVGVSFSEGDLLIQLRISDRLHLSSGWMAVQYVPVDFDQSTPRVVLDILTWAHEEAQRLITAHRLYHEGIRG